MHIIINKLEAESFLGSPIPRDRDETFFGKKRKKSGRRDWKNGEANTENVVQGG